MTHKKRGRHDKGVDALEDRLNGKHWIVRVEKDKEYPFGQFDLLVTTINNHKWYLEYKSRDSYVNFRHAKEQLYRGTKWLKSQFKKLDSPGIYYSPQRVVKVAYNGRTYHSRFVYNGGKDGKNENRREGYPSSR